MSELEYWEKRYSQGGNSGFGSSGIIRDWKWKIIEAYVPIIDDVVDVGCGDLQFWQGRDCKKYIGIDISPTIITKNTYVKPYWKFICGNAKDYFKNIQGEVVLCIDLLYHIRQLQDFIAIVENLVKYTKKWLFIYTLITNPYRPVTSDDVYQFYRPLGRVQTLLEKELILMSYSRNPYHPIAGFYVFLRKPLEEIPHAL